MQFGICTPVENSAAAREAGFDFIEVRVDQLIEGLLPDAQWKGAERADKSALPIPSANVLVPAELKITGPEANPGRLESYMKTVLSRCVRIGIRKLILGSGAARKIPDGFDRQRARRQMIEFLTMLAPLLKEHGITLVIKPLNRQESNIINSITEAVEYVREVNHPNIRCVIDVYHFWMNAEPLESLAPAVASIAHVNISDRDRKAPKKDDLRPFLAVLKRGGYGGPIAVEANDFDIAKDGRSVLGYVRDQWNNC